VAGPLNLDRELKKATTVLGAELLLSDKEFDALTMLVEREGESIAFEELYKEIWCADKRDISKELALSNLSNLLSLINEAGKGLFMGIEYDEEAGYTFSTKWGHSWRKSSEEPVIIEEIKSRTDPPSVAAKKQSKIIGGIMATGMVAAAFFIVIMGRLPNALHTVSDEIYIFDNPVPLGAAPNFTDAIVFPEIADTVISSSAGLLINFYNPEENSDNFVFEITLADSGEILYTSAPMAPGSRTESIEIQPLNTGEHRAVLNITVYDFDGIMVASPPGVNFMIKVY